jgi:hypothetical protein
VFDLLSAVFEPAGQGEPQPQRLGDRKARGVISNLDQESAGFAEIDRAEDEAVDHTRGRQAKRA